MGGTPFKTPAFQTFERKARRMKPPYLVVPPSYTADASKYGFRTGRLAYKIENMHLMRGRIGANVTGGLMIIGSLDISREGDFKTLAGEISNECARHGFEAVMLDFDGKPDNKSAGFAASLGSELAKRKVPCIVPIDFSMFCPDAVYIVTSEISGGSLKLRLIELIERFGKEKIAFAICRMRMDFLMPSPEGKGRELTAGEFDTLYRGMNAQAFYSPELCLNYFTYTDDTGQSHFVLFDDVRSILGKVYMSDMLGVGYTLLNYPELRDILPEISAGLKSD
jgi:hypothetical protein